MPCTRLCLQDIMKRIGKAAALGPLDENLEPDEEVRAHIV